MSLFWLGLLSLSEPYLTHLKFIWAPAVDFWAAGAGGLCDTIFAFSFDVGASCV